MKKGNKRKFTRKLKTLFLCVLSLIFSLRWWKTKKEKIQILRRHLIRAFADYDITTGEVNIFPTTRAQQEIEKMLKQGTVNYHFDLLQLHKKCARESRKIARKYKVA